MFSATSFMAARLRDGGDLDSADRSLLEAESGFERTWRPVPSWGLRADILSLDPGALSLMSGLSGVDGVSLKGASEPSQSLGHPPHPPLIRSDLTQVTQGPRNTASTPGSNVRTMATKEWSKTVRLFNCLSRVILVLFYKAACRVFVGLSFCHMK